MNVCLVLVASASALTGICCPVETSFLLPPKCQLPTTMHLFGAYLIGLVKVSNVIGFQNVS